MDGKNGKAGLCRDGAEERPPRQRTGQANLAGGKTLEEPDVCPRKGGSRRGEGVRRIDGMKNMSSDPSVKDPDLF
ncbi:hypothetical protein B4135_0343 [Caldibacillus debilis]|uniref:Uncharacterized protein n=1 Tax=Caldibacillus debilis TaxID=301148 RepID=A0A150M5R5_9BACI|nr:hypothetical protein B4135_0343 [Caldibacillus debilis]